MLLQDSMLHKKEHAIAAAAAAPSLNKSLVVKKEPAKKQQEAEAELLCLLFFDLEGKPKVPSAIREFYAKPIEGIEQVMPTGAVASLSTLSNSIGVSFNNNKDTSQFASWVQTAIPVDKYKYNLWLGWNNRNSDEPKLNNYDSLTEYNKRVIHLDLYLLTKKLFGFPSYKLEHLCERFNIATKGHHQASTDVDMLEKLFFALVREYASSICERHSAKKPASNSEVLEFFFTSKITFNNTQKKKRKKTGSALTLFEYLMHVSNVEPATAIGIQQIIEKNLSSKLRTVYAHESYEANAEIQEIQTEITREQIEAIGFKGTKKHMRQQLNTNNYQLDKAIKKHYNNKNYTQIKKERK